MNSNVRVRFDGRPKHREKSILGKLLVVADALGNDRSTHSANRRTLILEVVDMINACTTRTVVKGVNDHLQLSAMNADLRFGQEVILLPKEQVA